MWDNWHPTMQQLVDNGVKVAPGLTITATSFLGISWEQWVYILTALFTAGQLSWFIYQRAKDVKHGCKHRRDRRESRKARESSRQDHGPDD